MVLAMGITGTNSKKFAVIEWPRLRRDRISPTNVSHPLGGIRGSLSHPFVLARRLPRFMDSPACQPAL